MRTIIAGSRSVTDQVVLWHALDNCGWEPSLVLCGKAKEADTLGEQWALDVNLPIEYYPADWDKFGKSAGMRRNAEMANNAEALIALWDGFSNGTANMIANAKRKKLKIHIQLV